MHMLSHNQVCAECLSLGSWFREYLLLEALAAQRPIET